MFCAIEKTVECCHNGNEEMRYRSINVRVLSPTYFNPCNVVFRRYCRKLSRQVSLQPGSSLPSRTIGGGGGNRFLWRITLTLIRGLGWNISACRAALLRSAVQMNCVFVSCTRSSSFSFERTMSIKHIVARLDFCLSYNQL